MEHQQATVKVNALVDQGVVPLVEALSGFPNILTTSSCEGGDDRPAFVAFTTCHSDWGQTGEFIASLSSKLREFPSLCDEAAFSLSLEWYAGGDVPSGYLRVPHRSVGRLAAAIKELAAAD
jgi:hypothetical protein